MSEEKQTEKNIEKINVKVNESEFGIIINEEDKDEIVKCNEYENLDPIDIRSLAVKIAKDIQSIERKRNKRFIQFAKVLYIIYKDSLWKKWNFRSFMEYANDDLSPVGYRSAKYMIDVYKTLIVKLHAPQEDVDKLGWTKGKELSKLANLGVVDEGNISDMIEFAHTSGRKDLENLVKESKKNIPISDNINGEKKFSVRFELPEDMHELWMTRREQYARSHKIPPQDVNDESFLSMVLLGTMIDYADTKEMISHWLEMMEKRLPNFKFIAVDTLSSNNPLVFGEEFVKRITIDDKEHFSGF